MRLIKTDTLQFHEFYTSQTPPYAILSHTWTDGEVSFQDMSSPDRTSKKGFAKILQTCRLAQESKLEYAWVDTCCIDKSSSAELTESINSMFQWYKDASACYVHLEDLQPHDSTEDCLVNCRWFTRGWTLQELIAPQILMFYDAAWSHRGARPAFVDIISKATMIPEGVLEGRIAPSHKSVAARMSWAANRETTRVEDVAYCLLGIFDVNMPLLYGEGARAFRRLQEEIVKRNNDLTIFAWDFPPNHDQECLELFASSPTAFARTFDVVPQACSLADFSVTNKGIRISNNAPLRSASIHDSDRGRAVEWYVLLLGEGGSLEDDGGIYLRKVGPNLFYRNTGLRLGGFSRGVFETYNLHETKDYYILTGSIDVVHHTLYGFRHAAIHVPVNDVLVLVEAVPHILWDITDRVFLLQDPYDFDREIVYATSLCGTIADITVDLIALCSNNVGAGADVSACKLKLFLSKDYSRQTAMLFGKSRERQDDLSWADLQHKAPELLELGDSVELRRENEVVVVTAVLFSEDIAIHSIQAKVPVFSLKFTITHR